MQQLQPAVLVYLDLAPAERPITCFDRADVVTALDLQRDRLSRQGLDEYLHQAAPPEP